MSRVQQKNVEWYRSLPPLHIALRDLERLPEYSATNPTGVTIGKTWRRHNGAFDHEFKRAGGIPFWTIVRYEEDPDDPKMALIVTYRPVVKIPMGRVRYPCDPCTEPMECGSWSYCFKRREGWL
jgi:hypothetical protein